MNWIDLLMLGIIVFIVIQAFAIIILVSFEKDKKTKRRDEEKPNDEDRTS